jgi:hypothetical protein
MSTSYIALEVTTNIHTYIQTAAAQCSAQCTTFLLRIRTVMVLNFGPDTQYHDVLGGVPQSLQTFRDGTSN